MHKKRHPFILLFNILIFALAVLFYYTDILNFTIKGITPLLILPILTAFSLFNSPLTCAIVGVLCGVLMDSNMIDSYCFNAIMLLLIGVFVSVSSNNLFNKNIKSAIVLTIICCAFYFVLQWLVFQTNNVTLSDSIMYLLNFALPSAVYSSIFIAPFYYIYKHFNKIKSE